MLLRMLSRIRARTSPNPTAPPTAMQMAAELVRSGLFDLGYYLSTNPAVAGPGINLALHYVSAGADEGRNPNPLFDSSYYLSANPDVAAAKTNPLFHFIRGGAADGRRTHPRFDTSYYLGANPDVAEAGINPLLHFLRHGIEEGRAAVPIDLYDAFAARHAKTDIYFPAVEKPE